MGRLSLVRGDVFHEFPLPGAIVMAGALRYITGQGGSGSGRVADWRSAALTCWLGRVCVLYLLGRGTACAGVQDASTPSLQKDARPGLPHLRKLGTWTTSRSPIHEQERRQLGTTNSLLLGFGTAAPIGFVVLTRGTARLAGNSTASRTGPAAGPPLPDP